MRFRFCGGLEPPDWLLAEIPVLAAQDVSKVKQVCDEIRNCEDDVDPILQDYGFSSSDSQSVIAVLQFVLLEAARYNVSNAELAIELLQLGLVEGMVETIVSAYALDRDRIREMLSKKSFRFPAIQKMLWRVAEDKTRTPESTQVEMRLQLDRNTVSCHTQMEEKFLALHEELAQARLILQSLSR